MADKPTIVLMGVGGSGKGKFLNSIAEGMVSRFGNIGAATIQHKGREFFFASLPGVEPGVRGEAEAIKENAGWLSRASSLGMQIVSLIYFHPITEEGLTYETYRYCNVFQRLVGEAAFAKIVLVSSKGTFIDAVTTGRRQKTIEETVWAEMLGKGARTARFDDSRESALEVFRESRHQSGGTLTLSIQREMNLRRLPLDSTDVGMNSGQDIGKMDEQRYQKLLAALLFEYMIARERADTKVAAPLLDRVIGLRKILRAMQDRRRPLGGQEGERRLSLRNGSPLYDELQPGQIRLVILQAGDESDPVEIRLNVRNLEEIPEYEALSYVVGKPDLIGTVRVRSEYEVWRRPVSQSLQRVLKVLRHSEKDRMLWVDALSIDQENLEERSMQVRMMSQIFRIAKNVCIWLGPANDPDPYGGLSSDRAMRFIKEIVDFSKLDTYVADRNKSDDWTGLAALLGRDWFRRRWVVQEMALAQQATVYCGTAQVPWSVFVDAVALYGTKWEEIIRMRGQNEAFKLGEVQAPGAASLVAISSNIFRKDRNGAIQERLLSVETLLSILPMFDVTNILDSFYAIMDLGSDTYGSTEIPVDYNLQPVELFRAVTQVAIRNSKSLDIICRPWAPKCELPSWIRTISDYAFVRRRDERFDPEHPDGLYDRRRADSLVGLPGQRRYNAAGDTIPRDVAFLQTMLFTAGIELGVVQDIAAQCLNGNIPADWMKLGGWSGSADDAPESFWRTLVADRAPDGTNPPSWYARAFRHSFSYSYPDAVDTSRLIQRYKKSSNVQEFLRRVQAATWSRIFFKMETLGQVYSGLGPAGIRKGDVVCILFGCSVPVILRSKDVDKSTHELIGECFVYGMMEGQGIKGVQAGNFMEHKFRID